MLDTVAEAWAESYGGANIWENPEVTFLDPFTKTGVFLREVTRRLTTGLAEQIPDLGERVDHILTKQVFGIGITQLTALLARRSVYCSKDATGEHSIARSFDRDWGNIWFERTEHTWAGPRCGYCSAQRDRFAREVSLETHAYAFIHTTDIKARLVQMFGADVQFDVIIGNPPYQMAGASGGSSDASIYHLFVQQAQRLEPRFLTMIVPSRWMAGGRGMDEFRGNMLGGKHLAQLVDFPVSRDVFPGVEVKGGVGYFLWQIDSAPKCKVAVVRDGKPQVSLRALDEFDVFIRDAKAVSILRKVLAADEVAMDTLVSNREPFKFESNFDGYHPNFREGDVPIYFIRPGKRSVGYVSRSAVTKNTHLIDSWKVLIPKAGSDGGQRIPDVVLGKPVVASNPSVCTGSYLAICVDSESAAVSIASYYRTKFFRFLVSLRKITQDAFRPMYSWVPVQSWNQNWTDDELNAKYQLTEDEAAFIESVVKPMELDDA
ncbi:MAG: Eco57I restriction-modification methylase domain-containing protein [Cryobacterium sp.]|nr:Eco57I restriction-modification methylase domain-containing protein [Cryobacterium sp.]